MRTPPYRRRLGRLLVPAALMLGLLTAACGGGDGRPEVGAGEAETPATTATAPATGAPAVTMRLVAFRPDRLEVRAGATVTWSQTDPGVHTVTSGTVDQGAAGVTPRPDGRFDSGDVATRGTFAFTFAEPGTYPYFCAVHPATMRGEVRVA